MSRKPKKPMTLLERFTYGHYMSYTPYGECDMGEHIDVECSCGYKKETYASVIDIVAHVLDVAQELLSEDKVD